MCRNKYFAILLKIIKHKFYAIEMEFELIHKNLFVLVELMLSAVNAA